MAISKDTKSKQLAALQNLLKTAKVAVFADYTGLKVNQTNDLRKKLAEVGSTLTIAKNSLLEKSLTESKLAEDITLKGQSAVVTSEGDFLATIKALYSYIKTAELPKVVFGFIDGKRVELAKIRALSEIPSKEILLGRLLGSIKSPMSKLVIGLSEVAKKKV
jgi:large subunit ribosomal protein L10